MERRIKTQLKLEDITFDEKFYPRTMANWQTSYSYSESMKAGSKFPPITVALYKNKKILVDGKHRMDACKINKTTEIEAEVFTGWNEDKIYLEALKRNMTHGRVLSPYEKRMAIMKLRAMKMKPDEISQIIHIPVGKLQSFVGQRLVSATTGEVLVDNVIKSGIKHIAGEGYSGSEFSNINEIQKGMYFHDQLSLLDQLIDLLKNNLLDFSDAKIKERVNILRELL